MLGSAVYVLVVGILTLASVVSLLLTGIVVHWLVVDHRARRNYALRVHTREHAFTPDPRCRLCKERLA